MSAGSEEPLAQQSEADTSASQPRVPRFRPGFAWGLAAGAIAVVVILGVLFYVNQYLVLQRLMARGTSSSPPSAEQPFVVNAASAGTPWFSVSASGTGVLHGWTTGSSDSGGDQEPAGSVGSIEVGTFGVLDGIRVMHSTEVYLTRQTQVIIGTQPYSKGKAPSVADAIINADNGADTILDNRPLTIDFHRQSGYLVADKIIAPLEQTTNPLQQ
jgi:hypothetical protein